MVEHLRKEGVDPEEIKRQRALGWPDFRPETYCHECGRPNVKSWFTPDWVQVTGSHGTILCPPCFTAKADVHFPSRSGYHSWSLIRQVDLEDDEVEVLAAFLLSVTGPMDEDLLEEETRRLAMCILHAGYRRSVITENQTELERREVPSWLNQHRRK